jgi:hypothetical protein
MKKHKRTEVNSALKKKITYKIWSSCIMFIRVKALLSDSPPIQRYEPATQEINIQGIKRWSDHFASCSCLNGIADYRWPWWLQVVLQRNHFTVHFNFITTSTKIDQTNLTVFVTWQITEADTPLLCINLAPASILSQTGLFPVCSKVWNYLIV